MTLQSTYIVMRFYESALQPALYYNLQKMILSGSHPPSWIPLPIPGNSFATFLIFGFNSMPDVDFS